MKKTLYFAFFFVTFLMFLSEAKAETLFCMQSGQTIPFSDCNPAMEDYVCTTNSCTVCVSQLPSGVYCPANLDNCQDACVAFEGEIGEDPLPPDAPVITINSPVNGHTIPASARVDFIYRVTRSNTINSCSLLLNGETVKSSSTITSGNNLLFYTVPEGTHTWRISCRTRSGAFPTVLTLYSESRTIQVGQTAPPQNTTPPGISLTNPSNGLALTGQQNVTFTFDFVNATSNQVSQCYLYLNSATYNINKDTRSLTRSVPIGQYSWYIKCFSTALGDLISETRTLTINDPSNPVTASLVLTSPANGFSSTGQQDVTFSFNYEGITSSQITQCNLFLNSEQLSIDKTSRSLTRNLSPNSYSWYVKCTKSTGGDITSETRTLTINSESPASNPAPSSGGGGGGGGGGGSSSSRRTTTVPKPDLSTDTIKLSKIEPTENEETPEEVEDASEAEEETESGFSISGAVVGVSQAVKKNIILVLTLTALILAVAMVLVLVISNRKRDAKIEKMRQEQMQREQLAQAEEKAKTKKVTKKKSVKRK